MNAHVLTRSAATLLAAALLAGPGAAARAEASELGDIRDQQKKILERLDAQDKMLKDILGKLSGGGRPQIDPNKVYNIALNDSAIRGPKNAKVTLVEFSDFQ
jgi:protein-disulfide isomerase